MSNGYLKQNAQGEWGGRIITRNVDFEFKLRLNVSSNPKAPAFKVMTKSKMGNYFEVGVVFQKETKQKKNDETGEVTGGEVFYSFSIDDPSLSAPLYVTAFPAKEPEREGEFDIVWQRPKAKEQAA